MATQTRSEALPKSHLAENLKNRGWVTLTFILALILLVLFFLSFSWGRYGIPLEDIFKVFMYKLGIADVAFASDFAPTVIFEIRLPRILSAIIIGASLSVAGASYQGLFTNPLVSPDILGVSAGAGFGAALGILISGNPFVIQILAFTFGILAVFVAYSVSNLVRNNSILTLILAGMAIGSLFNALLSLTKYLADPTEKLPEIVYWLMGSLGNISNKDILMAGIPMAISLIILMAIRWQLNALSMGEEEALALGVDIKKLRLIVILCSTIMTASAVCVSGVIGWIGLVIPHMARLLVGPCHRRMLPVTALLGSIFLLSVDNLTRSAASVEIPIGILTALLGVPFFLYLLSKSKKGWA